MYNVFGNLFFLNSNYPSLDMAEKQQLTKTKLATADLVALLNGIKDTSANVDISSVTNLILKSIMSSSSQLPEIKKSQLKIETKCVENIDR